MANCRNEYLRRVIKTATITGVIPTIPPSDNHKDGSWIATDIYKGELFFNRADGILYSRDDGGIIVIGGGAGNFKRFRANFAQSGTDAPDVTVFENSIGDLIWTRSGVGQYTITSDSKFTVGYTFILLTNHTTDFASNAVSIMVRPNDIDTIYLASANLTVSGADVINTLADSLITGASIEIVVYPEPIAS